MEWSEENERRRTINTKQKNENEKRTSKRQRWRRWEKEIIMRKY